MLSVKNLIKIYHSKKAKDVKALNDVSIDFPETGLVFLLGKSGSGKSTLLNSIGGLDKFDSGEIIIKGKSSKDFSGSDFDSYRNTFIGFIFQEYNILEEFSVEKNIALALELQGKNADKEKIDKLLNEVDMLEYANRKPNELSGGQKQRVAIARALIKNPEIIMADEPTGALDSNTGKQVMETLKKLSKTKLVIIVSHDREFAETYGDRIIELKDGKIIHDVTKKEILSSETKSGIKVIDNKIIYIKQGQTLTDQELKNITQIIKNHSQKSDTFISFDEEGNETLKEGSKINDAGNKEKFLDTTPEDVELKQYNPNSLKLIKSKLKFKDSFKMGASSLKYKKVKLFFTILLSLIAFTLFGLADTFASFNKNTSICETLETKKQYLLSLDAQYMSNGYSQSVSLTQSKIDNLEEKTNLKTYPVYDYSNVFDISGETEDSSYKNDYNSPFYVNVSGVMAINSTIQENLELEFVSTTPISRLPANDNEICISKHLADCFIKKYSSISNYNHIINKQTTSGQTIVGIIDDKTDFSKYKKLEESSNRNTYSANDILLYQEILTIQEYDISYMIFSTQSFADESLLVSSEKYYYTKNTSGLWFSSTTSNTYYNNLSPNNQNSLNSLITFKNGITNINQLSKNQIVISQRNLSYILSELDKTEANFFDDGEVYLSLYNDYDCENEFATFEIVGLFTGNSFYDHENHRWIGTEENIVSETTFNRIFMNYKFSLVNVKNHDGLKSLVNYISKTSKTEKTVLHIQSPYTLTIDGFGDTIEQISSYIIYVALGFAVFAGILLANYISTSISYKKREIGILRAIGARSVDVFKIFFNESFLITLINYILSVIATIVACFFINKSILDSLGINITLLTFGIRQIILMLGISVLVAVISSFLPVNKIARKKPVDAINNR